MFFYEKNERICITEILKILKHVNETDNPTRLHSLNSSLLFEDKGKEMDMDGVTLLKLPINLPSKPTNCMTWALLKNTQQNQVSDRSLVKALRFPESQVSQIIVCN